MKFKNNKDHKQESQGNCCNCTTPDVSFDPGLNLWDIANLEAGTDINTSGATEIAPSKNLAEYKMVAHDQHDDDDNLVDMGQS